MRVADRVGNESAWVESSAAAVHVVTKYYYFSGKRVAMRQGSAVYYLHGDHLGSASLVTDGGGNVVSQSRYLPYGKQRWSSGAKLTDFGFTGQRADGFGLMDYHARYYSSALGRFISVDSIVPNAYFPTDYDRYAYSRNSPVIYTDPSGHNWRCGPDGIWCSNNFEEAYGITFEGDWTIRNKAAVRVAVKAVASKSSLTLGWGNAAMAFSMEYYKGVTLAWVNSYEYNGVVYTSGAVTRGSTRIEVASLSELKGKRTAEMAFTDARNNIVHELGHAFANLWNTNDPNNPYDQSGPYGNEQPIDSDYLNNNGFYPSPISAQLTWRQHPCNTAGAACGHETFADMFLGWTFGKWADNNAGEWRDNYMTTNMAEWVPAAARR